MDSLKLFLAFFLFAILADKQYPTLKLANFLLLLLNFRTYLVGAMYLKHSFFSLLFSKKITSYNVVLLVIV